jgi:hypothetical protein
MGYDLVGLVVLGSDVDPCDVVTHGERKTKLVCELGVAVCLFV